MFIYDLIQSYMLHCTCLHSVHVYIISTQYTYCLHIYIYVYYTHTVSGTYEKIQAALLNQCVLDNVVTQQHIYI